MNKLIYSYGKQFIDRKDINNVKKTLLSSKITQGPKIEHFEKLLSKKISSKYCGVVSSGTAALHLVGLSLGWSKDDIVITTPLTFAATINSIIYSGATPDLVDINQENYTIDPKLVEEKIKFYNKKNKKVKAVIAVDYAGHPCDWKSLKFIAKKYKLKLINDFCHALGASFNNDNKYPLKYADIATLSFHPVKQITTGEGGAILTNNKRIYNKIISMRSHGVNLKKNYNNKNKPWFYEIDKLGFNYRITDIQCALGISQLKKLNKTIILKRNIARQYDINFKNDDRFIIPKKSNKVMHAYHLYPLRINFDILKVSKSFLFKKLIKKNIFLQVHYIPLHFHSYYKKKYKFKKGNYPVAEKIYGQVVSLPIYRELKLKDINYISNEIKNICKLK